MKLVVGTDEVASGTQQVDGYVFVVLRESVAAVLASRTTAIRAKHGVRVFHGREFQPAQAAAYREFLSAVRDAMLEPGPSRISLVLYSAEERRRVIEARTGLMEKAYAGNGQKNRRLLTTSRVFVPQLVEFQRLTAGLAADGVADVELDRDDRKDVLAKLAGSGPAAPLSAAALLRAFYHAHRTLVFPTAPRLGELRVLPDEASAVVQAADVIGNFAMAHGFVCLGASSPHRTTRAALLEGVLDLEDAREFFQANVEMQGNDLVLKQGAAIRLEIG